MPKYLFVDLTTNKVITTLHCAEDEFVECAKDIAKRNGFLERNVVSVSCLDLPEKLVSEL